jgi:hypothetical protein
MWLEAGYESRNFLLPEDSDVEAQEVEEDLPGQQTDWLRFEAEHDAELSYVSGDFTRPPLDAGRHAVLVHVVDDSGSWGQGGVFTALSRLGASVAAAYELAGAMDDLHLGDAHVVPVTASLTVALCVAQSRSAAGNVSAVQLPALAAALRRVAIFCLRQHASAHLPRIGHDTRNFSWYSIERVLRAGLPARGVPATVYYFPRRLSLGTATTAVLPLAATGPPSRSSSSSGEPQAATVPLPPFLRDTTFLLHSGVPGKLQARLTRLV